VFEARSRQRPLLEVTVIQHGTQHLAFAGFEHAPFNFMLAKSRATAGWRRTRQILPNERLLKLCQIDLSRSQFSSIPNPSQ